MAGGVEAAGDEEQAAEREGPEQVELFFDGERPELQDGVGGDVRRRSSPAAWWMKYQFVTYKNAALNDPAALRTSAGDAIAVNTIAVTISATNAAGSSRRNRRA